jgi:hypothetical protein
MQFAELVGPAHCPIQYVVTLASRCAFSPFAIVRAEMERSRDGIGGVLRLKGATGVADRIDEREG